MKSRGWRCLCQAMELPHSQSWITPRDQGWHCRLCNQSEEDQNCQAGIQQTVCVLPDFLLLVDFRYINSVYVMSTERAVQSPAQSSLGFVKLCLLQRPTSNPCKGSGAEQHMGKLFIECVPLTLAFQAVGRNLRLNYCFTCVLHCWQIF